MTGPRSRLIGKRAGVSKSDFYKHFESKDACFIAAYDDAVERIRTRVLACLRGGRGLGERGHRRARRAAGSPRRRAGPGRLLLVEGLRAGRGIYDRYQAGVAELRALPARRCAGAAGGEPPPEATDEAVVGGIASLLGRRVLAGEAASSTSSCRRLRSLRSLHTWAQPRRAA